MVHFRQYQPCKALAAYVKCYWTLEHSYLPAEPEHILPDGCLEMIFHYGDKYVSVIDGRQAEQPEAIIVGQISSAIKLRPTGKTGIFAVRFYPWGLYPFAGRPLNEFTDSFCDVSEIFGKDIADISDQLLHASSSARANIVEQYLLRRLADQRSSIVQQADRLAPLLREVYSAGANASVEAMAGMANLSVRQFNRTVNSIVGISPKQLTRIVRLQQFFTSYRASEERALTRLLYECGYYDQAHFIRDFKSISGLNPTEFFKQKNEMGELMML